jgi:PAS domain S-box-containing protein
MKFPSSAITPSAGALAAAMLFAVGGRHLLLLHCFAEMFSVVLLCAIAMFAWNARKFLDNGYFLFLGLAFLPVAFFDTMHMLAYRGLDFLNGYPADLSTRFWVAGQYVESSALLLAIFVSCGESAGQSHNFLKGRAAWCLAGLYGLCAFLLLSILYWRNFPPCFYDGTGLTAFKKNSEYFVIALMAAALFLTSRRRDRFSPGVLKLMLAAIMIAMLAEFTLTFYGHIHDWINTLGHVFAMASVYLVYRAVVETGITTPYSILLREINQRELSLRESEKRFRDISYSLADWVWELDTAGRFVFCSFRASEMMGYPEAELLGRTPFDFMDPEQARKMGGLFMADLMARRPARGLETWVFKKNGEKLFVSLSGVPVLDDAGNVTGFRGVTQDITARIRAESEIRRLASFPQNNPAPIIEADLAGNIFYANDAALRLFPDLRAAPRPHPFLTGIEHMFESDSDGVRSREIQIDSAWFHQTVTYDALSGRARFYTSDITDVKHFEELLRRKQEELQILFDSVPAMIFYKDRENRFINVNRTAAAFFGKSKEDVIGHLLTEFYPPEQAAASWRDDIEVITSGKSKPDISYPVKTKAGIRTMEMEKVPYRDAAGNIIGIIVFALDVTERLDAEAARIEAAEARMLREERQRFNELMETLPVGIVLLAPDYRVVFANKFVRDRFGVPEGKRCFELFYGAHAPCPACGSRGVLEDGLPRRWELEIDGGRWYDFYACRFREPDGSHLILKMGIDVTERKLAQRELAAAQEEAQKTRRLADIGSLAATVAHELRNPLAAIRMAAHNIYRHAHNPEAERHLRNIDKKIRESNHIIHNLLFYARIRSPHRERISLSALIAEAVAGAHERFAGQAVSVDVLFPQDSAITLDADPVQLLEVFSNLLDNAYAALPAQGGRIRISVDACATGVTVRVSDNGSGIAPENLSRVLEPFFTTKVNGTGLGLSVCSQIMRLHDGSLDVSSTPDKGTDITLHFAPASSEFICK